MLPRKWYNYIEYKNSHQIRPASSDQHRFQECLIIWAYNLFLADMQKWENVKVQTELNAMVPFYVNIWILIELEDLFIHQSNI